MKNLHGTADLFGFIMAILISFIIFNPQICHAEEPIESTEYVSTESTELTEPDDITITTELPEGGLLDVPNTSQTNTTIEYVLEFPESIGTYEINEDDYNSPEYVGYALNNNVYAGSYNSTITTIWNGLIQNNVGKDYLAYRSSQYQYYIFFGENFEYSNGRFSGSGTYYALNTQNNGYNYTIGQDSFSVNVSDGYVYTNVTDDYPALDNDRGLLYEQLQTVAIISLLAFSVLRWIFINK